MHLTLDYVHTVASTGYHCAFTSLMAWGDHLYMAYREAQSHGVYPPGKIVLMRTLLPEKGQPLAAWTTCATIHTGGDDRDPKLFDAGARGLGLTWGTYYPRWPRTWENPNSIPSKSSDLLSHTAYSRNGTVWSANYQMYRPGYWVWSVVQHEHKHVRLWYAAAYHSGDGGADASHSIHLLASADAINWSADTTILEETHGKRRLPSEPALCVIDADTLGCMIRQEEYGAIAATASAPYLNWNITELAECIHSAALCQTPHGWIVAGRRLVEVQEPEEGKGNGTARRKKKPPQQDASDILAAPTREASMDLWAFDWRQCTTTHLMTLPSFGDCGYPGLVWDAQRQVLWCSYYSQHAYREAYDRKEVMGIPTPADVYVAQFTVER